MKRIVPLLLSLMLLVGCAGAAGPAAYAVYTANASPVPASTAAPEGAEGPRVTAPFLYYRYFDQPYWEELTSAVMFSADLDQDGAAEPVSFALDAEEDTTSITWGESTIVLEEGCDFVEATVMDLDTESPFYNLLVVIDYGSDSYVTIELHPENGQLIHGAVIQGSWDWEDDALWFYERTDFLGTAFGQRTYRGDTLTPDSEWLTLCYVPTEEELAGDWASLIDGGTLLHAVLPVPCTMDGQPDVIPADSYVYRLRFRNDDDLTEVSFLDGTLALIACTVGEDGWPYFIEGRDAMDYFDNLFFAD